MGDVTISAEAWRDLEKIVHSLKGLRNLQRLDEREQARVAGHMNHNAERLQKWIRRQKAQIREEAHSGT